MPDQPIDPSELGQFVDAFMDSGGCCHDLMFTQAWLKGQGWTLDEIAAWAAGQNITCDCETISKFNRSNV